MKTIQNMEKIRRYLQEYKIAKTCDIAEMLALSMARTRAILSKMEDIEAIGVNKARRYQLKKEK